MADPVEGRLARRVHIEPEDDGYRWTFVYHDTEIETHVVDTAREAFYEGSLRAVPAEGGFEQVAIIGQAAVFASLALVFLADDRDEAAVSAAVEAERQRVRATFNALAAASGPISVLGVPEDVDAFKAAVDDLRRAIEQETGE